VELSSERLRYATLDGMTMRALDAARELSPRAAVRMIRNLLAVDVLVGLRHRGARKERD
jgi:hypothetical protein